MILVVNNGGQYTHLIGRALRDAGVRSRLVSNQLPLEEIREADGIILSGGPSLDGAGNSGLYSRGVEVPVLGICLGHQVMAEEFGGRVGPGERGGYAEVEVELLGDSLFEGIGGGTRVWASHADEVKDVPPGFRVTARSEMCDVEAMRHLEKPAFGVQFHPEVHHTEEGTRMLKNFAELCR